MSNNRPSYFGWCMQICNFLNSSSNRGSGAQIGEDGRPREIYAPKEVGMEELWKDQISTGINFSKYDNINVKVDGENKPRPIETFQSAGLAPVLLENILRAKYSTPTPVQKHGLPIIMARRDLMACAQTGSGKTAAFLFPILHRILETRAESWQGAATQAPQAIIITPTRELAIQIFDEARKFSAGSNVRTAILYGGTSTQFQRGQLARGANILVATPGKGGRFMQTRTLIGPEVQLSKSCPIRMSCKTNKNALIG